MRKTRIRDQHSPQARPIKNLHVGKWMVVPGFWERWYFSEDGHSLSSGFVLRTHFPWVCEWVERSNGQGALNARMYGQKLYTLDREVDFGQNPQLQRLERALDRALASPTGRISIKNFLAQFSRGSEILELGDLLQECRVRKERALLFSVD